MMANKLKDVSVEVMDVFVGRCRNGEDIVVSMKVFD